MRNVVIYNPGTGEVERWMRDHDDIVTAEWFPGKAVLFVDPQTKPLGALVYVVDGVLVERPAPTITVDREAIAAGGQDVATIAGIPAGTVARIVEPDGVDVLEIDEGELQVSAAEPRTIVVDLEPPFPLRRHRVRVTAA